MAPPGQLVAQAPHSMHASGSATRTFPPSSSSTPWGQTSVHSPHPEHFSGSTRRVDTPVKWRKSFMNLFPFVYPANPALIHPARARPTARAWNGMARRISFSTPEPEVNGVDPVKFMAR